MEFLLWPLRLVGAPAGVVGQVTGAMLVAKLLLSAKATWYDAGAVKRKAQQGAQADSPAFGGSAA